MQAFASLALCTVALRADSIAPAPCRSRLDCSLGGDCNDGKCTCEPGWEVRPRPSIQTPAFLRNFVFVPNNNAQGDFCETLKVGSSLSRRTIANLPVSRINGTDVNTVWGGHSAIDEQGVVHWFGSIIMNGGGLGGWTTESALGHGISTHANESAPLLGPFNLTDIPISPHVGGEPWEDG